MSSTTTLKEQIEDLAEGRVWALLFTIYTDLCHMKVCASASGSDHKRILVPLHTNAVFGICNITLPECGDEGISPEFTWLANCATRVGVGCSFHIGLQHGKVTELVGVNHRGAVVVDPHNFFSVAHSLAKPSPILGLSFAGLRAL